MADNSKRPYWLDEDDDGRTIADMSGVKRRNLFMPNRFEDDVVTGSESPEKREKNRVVEENGLIMDEAEMRDYRPWEERNLNKEETRSWIFSATAAGLMLVGIFIAAGWLFIHFLIWIWS